MLLGGAELPPAVVRAVSRALVVHKVVHVLALLAPDVPPDGGDHNPPGRWAARPKETYCVDRTLTLAR